MSPPITGLVLTCESKANPDLIELANELTPTDDVYQNALQKVVTNEVIPWLGTIDTLRFIHLATNLTPTCACRTPPLQSQLEFRSF